MITGHTTGRASSAAPRGASIGNLKVLVEDQAAFIFLHPWRVESRESRFHPWKLVRPCKTIEAAVELYEFLGEWPLSRVRVN